VTKPVTGPQLSDVETSSARAVALAGIASALRQAAHVLPADPYQLAAQLIGRGHTGPVDAVAVSDDGRLALSGDTDGVIKVWNLGNGIEMFSLTGH